MERRQQTVSRARDKPRARFGASALLTVGALAVFLAPTGAGAHPPATPEPGAIHVDCQASPGGTGSERAPLNSLAAASAETLRPGGRLLFARGTVCRGSLEVQSSGTPQEPVIVGAYGAGPLPKIEGTETDAVLLENASDLIVEDLAVTNQGAPDVQRRGVHLVANGALVQNVTLRRLSIHDVDGNLTKDSGGSGGIQLDALGPSPAGRFNDIAVTDNQIEHVSRSGIFIVGTQNSSRPPATQPWADGSTGIVVSHNSVKHVAGDGIVSTGTVGAVLEDNTVFDGNQAGTLYTQPGAICDAGIWAWNANSSVIQDNVVSHMEFNGCDGEGYDVDYNQDGTIVQDNVSDHNAGGFILLCTDQNPHHGDVRYNLSVDDAASIEEAPCAIGAGNVGTLNGVRMYNNTFVAHNISLDLELSPLTSMFAPGDFAFLDNILVATSAQPSAMPCGTACTNNLYFKLPPSGSNPVVGPAGFVDPVLRGTTRTAMGAGFRVGPHSPAIQSGAVVSNGATEDFFGHPVPASRPPTIGFDQVGG